MLVVVLIPLVLMVLACLLERFEARAIPGEPARRSSRASRTSSPAVTTAERPRHLTLIAGTGSGDDASDRGRGLDPDTLRLALPKAS